MCRLHRSVSVLVTALSRIVDETFINGGPGFEAHENGKCVEERFEEAFHNYISFLLRRGREAPLICFRQAVD